MTGGFGRTSEMNSFNTDGRQVYKLHGPFRSVKTEAPAVNDASDVLALRLFVFNWLGSWSFVLRCADAEQALQSKDEREKYTAKWDEFANMYTDMSMKHLQMDVHNALSDHFRTKCPFLIQFVDLGTSEDAYCATALWNNVISHYSPTNPTVQALTYARIATALMKGSHAGNAEQLAAYNKTINSSKELLHDIPPMSSDLFVACMTYAGVVNTNDSLAADIRRAVELNNLAFTTPNIRYFINTNTKAGRGAVCPDVTTLEANKAMLVGMKHPAQGCGNCPLGHCQFPDGKYRPAPNRVPVKGPRKPTLKPAAKVAFANDTSGNDTSGVEASGGETSDDDGSGLPSMVSANTVSLLDDLKLTGGHKTQDLVAKLEESIQNDDARRMYEMGKVVNAARRDELSDGEYW